jgi:cysteine desulfurase
VLDAMMPYLTDKFGNAASRTHRYGWEAEEAVQTARQQVAAYQCLPEEIIFTSGYRSDNLKRHYLGIPRSGTHLHRATEHKPSLDTCKALEQRALK